MKNLFLVLGVLLMLGGLGSVGYGVERYLASNESFTMADQQAQEAKELEGTNIERATELMNFAADNAEMGNEQRSQVWIYTAIGLGFFMGGSVLAMRGRKNDGGEMPPLQ